ncbi:MAG: nucleotide disphospho-sugar-binding domain-containing protein [Pseudonocardiaceae bacterium]
MRVLLVPFLFPTHYLPMVGLAWALRLHGHEVLVATAPKLAATVAQSGMTSVTVGPDFDFLDSPELKQQGAKWAKHASDGPTVSLLEAIMRGPVDRYAMAAEAMADDLVALAETWRPDVVLSDPLAFAGPLAAEVSSAVSVRHLWGPDTARNYRMPGSGFGAPDDVSAVPWEFIPWPDRLTALYERFGAKAADDLAEYTIDPCPESMQFPGGLRRRPIRYTAYNGGGTIPRRLLEPHDKPRVCVTWGTATTSTLSANYFGVPKALDALRDLDAEIVVAARTADVALINDMPGNVIAAEPLPLDALLPTCDAIVHHGGAGTLFTAARHGLSQLTLGILTEQRANCSQLARQGAGVFLPFEQADRASVRASVAELLEPGPVRTKAAELREEIARQPSPVEVAKSMTAM